MDVVYKKVVIKLEINLCEVNMNLNEDLVVDNDDLWAINENGVQDNDVKNVDYENEIEDNVVEIRN